MKRKFEDLSGSVNLSQGNDIKKQKNFEEQSSVNSTSLLDSDSSVPATEKESEVLAVSPIEDLKPDFSFSHSFFSDSSSSAPTKNSPIADCFSPLLNVPKFGCKNLKKPSHTNFDIYSISTLKTLLDEKEKNKELPDLRFLVDLDKNALFARETHQRIPAPAHYQMTGELQKNACCITAGNLFLSPNYKQLLKANHKSGDFRPSFDSLKWFIAILILNEKRLPFSLPEKLIIEELNYSGKVIRTLEWNVAELRSWVMKVFTDEKIVSHLLEQEQKIRKVNYAHSSSGSGLTWPSSYSLGGSALAPEHRSEGSCAKPSSHSLVGSELAHEHPSEGSLAMPSSYSLGSSALASGKSAMPSGFSLGGSALALEKHAFPLSFSLGSSALASGKSAMPSGFSLGRSVLDLDDQKESPVSLTM